MNELKMRPVGAKRIRISGIHPLLAVCLQEMPAILELRDKTPAHERLFPPLTANDRLANAEWQESIEPDLRHLFVSAGETVTRDLTGLSPQPREPKRSCVTIPIAHVSAWMSAVNQARLILGAMFGIANERDMLLTTFDSRNPKQVAIIKIELLGELLARFVDLETGEVTASVRGRRPSGKTGRRAARRKNSTPQKRPEK